MTKVRNNYSAAKCCAVEAAELNKGEIGLKKKGQCNYGYKSSVKNAKSQPKTKTINGIMQQIFRKEHQSQPNKNNQSSHPPTPFNATSCLQYHLTPRRPWLSNAVLIFADNTASKAIFILK